MYKSIVFSVLLFFVSTSTYADRYCVKEVDKLQLFYVNGMFTDEMAFKRNLKSLDDFSHNYLSKYAIKGPVDGMQNYSEAALFQVAEVAFHKLTDEEKKGDKGRIVKAILRGKMQEFVADSVDLLAWFYTDIYEKVDTVVDETDYRNMKIRLETSLGKCARTILVTHSQGNFYGNRLYTEVMTTFSYPNGASITDYPMLGYIGIANPTFSYGGTFGVNNPSIAKTFTNSNDHVMTAVRVGLGAIAADPEQASLRHDKSGHGLKDSYLEDIHAPKIAKLMTDIVDSLTPYPMFEQHPSGSSAISHIGHSYVSNILDIRFKHGGGYRYDGVEQSTWQDFFNSTSHGKYFNQHIRNKFTYEKIEN